MGHVMRSAHVCCCCHVLTSLQLADLSDAVYDHSV